MGTPFYKDRTPFCRKHSAQRDPNQSLEPRTLKLGVQKSLQPPLSSELASQMGDRPTHLQLAGTGSVPAPNSRTFV